MRLVLTFLTAVMLVVSVPGLAAAREIIRVQVADGAEIRVGRDVRYKGRRVDGDAKEIRVQFDKGGLRIQGEADPGPVIVTSGSSVIDINGKRYRGYVKLYAEGGRLHAVNVVDLEDYLASVLGSEMGANWPNEALKAQAVVSRSYALARMKTATHKPYDVDATVLSQVYNGLKGEAASTVSAVKATRGEILTHSGKVAETFFHSACGGQTEDGGALWGGNVSHLSSVADPYCEDAPAYFWKHAIGPAELGRRVGLTKVSAVKVTRRGPGGRALQLVFEGGGQERKLNGDQVRRAVGYAKLKSTFFQVSVEDGAFVFKGSGAGHGVGMCQWGARGQAEEGRNYRQILAFYFPVMRLE